MLITECSLVDKLHKLPSKAVLFVTGGGLEIFPMLTHRGGGSATLLSGLIPYTQDETFGLLGFKPAKLVSEETTRHMAMVAYRRANSLVPLKERKPVAAWISDKQYPAVGVAANMVLQKTPDERIGREHTIYVAIQTDKKTVALTLHLNDSAKRMKSNVAELVRVWEEKIAARMILNAIAEAFESDDRVSLGYGLDELVERKESTLRSSYFRPLLLGELNRLVWNIDNGVPAELSGAEEAWCSPDGNVVPRYLVPGSFNPFHEGHQIMAKMSTNSDEFQSSADYELSITNVDKPPLDLIEIEKRLRTFTGNCRVWLTNAPTFVEKAEIFCGGDPGSGNIRIFAVGYDTALRICDPKYAGDIEQVCEVFQKNNIRFFVFGREQNGVYRSGLDEFPECFRKLATAMDTPLEYRGLSSSEIRNQLAAK